MILAVVISAVFCNHVHIHKHPGHNQLGNGHIRSKVEENANQVNFRKTIIHISIPERTYSTLWTGVTQNTTEAIKEFTNAWSCSLILTSFGPNKKP